MLHYRAMQKRPDMKLYNVFCTKRDDGKMNVLFQGQYLKEAVGGNHGIQSAGLIWSSKNTTPLVVDGVPNPDLSPAYIKKISDTNQFSVTINGMPVGKQTRGKLFVKILDKDGNEKYLFTEEGVGVNNGAEKSAWVSGLYDNSGKILSSWYKLVNEYGLDVTKDFTALSDAASARNTFRHPKLSSGTILVIDETVTAIGNNAFRQYDRPIEICMKEGLTHIGGGAFYENRQIKAITFPGTVKTIGTHVFTCSGAADYNLKTADMSACDFAEVTSTRAMFQFRHGLKEIKFPKNFIVSAYTFNHMAGYVLQDGVFTIPADWRLELERNGHYWYDFAGTTFKRFVVEEGNQHFAEVNGALYTKDLSSLLSIPDNLGVPDGVFEMAEGVTYLISLSCGRSKTINRIVIPNSLEVFAGTIGTGGDYSDDTCNLLSRMTYIYTTISEYGVKEDNPRYSEHEGCVYSKDYTKFLEIPYKYKGVCSIKDGCTTICGGAFNDNGRPSNFSNLTEIHIPASVTDIKAWNLGKINGLTHVTKTVAPENPVYTAEDNKVVLKSTKMRTRAVKQEQFEIKILCDVAQEGGIYE